MTVPSMYRLEFDAISDCDKPGSVHVTNKQKDSSVSAVLWVDDSQIHSPYFSVIPSIAADLIDVATAVHFADRMTTTCDDEYEQVEIVLPVRNPKIFNEAKEELENLLWWYTRIHWSFDFQLRTTARRASEYRQYFSMPDYGAPVGEIALWSGGLDSLAGLANRLVETESKFVRLFGTGSNSQVHNTQQNTYLAVAKQFPSRVSLVQLPIGWAETNVFGKSRYARSRGFVFALMGSVYAYLQGQKHLYIYENGIGAINLPFSPAEVGVDHTRAVHPTSLLKLGTFVSRIIDESFRIENPFVFSTKAQMCRTLTETGLEHIILETKTCDRQLRDKNPQCGCCSSCILRRQALASARIHDNTRYHVPYSRTSLSSDFEYFHVMQQQVRDVKRLLSSPSPWTTFEKAFPSQLDFTRKLAAQMATTDQSVQFRLLKLFETYVNEWSQVEDIIHKSIRNLPDGMHTFSESLYSGVQGGAFIWNLTF